MHDSGATSVIVGHETLRGYCKQLAAKGFPVSKIKFSCVPRTSGTAATRPVRRRRVQLSRLSLEASLWRFSRM
eukprot:2396550-Pyramimonas_sp.AAC.1